MNDVPVASNAEKEEPHVEKSQVEFAKQLSEELPPPMRSVFNAWLMSLRSESSQGPIDSVAEKLTPEHIGKIIEYGAKDDERAYKTNRTSQIISVVVLVIALLFAVFLLVFFKDSPHFTTIITALFSFLGAWALGDSRESPKITIKRTRAIPTLLPLPPGCWRWSIGRAVA